VDVSDECQAGRSVYFNVAPVEPARFCCKSCFFRCHMDMAGYAQAVAASVVWGYGGNSSNMNEGANVTCEETMWVNDQL
jgi:hypothetical protein